MGGAGGPIKHLAPVAMLQPVAQSKEFCSDCQSGNLENHHSRTLTTSPFSIWLKWRWWTREEAQYTDVALHGFNGLPRIICCNKITHWRVKISNCNYTLRFRVELDGNPPHPLSQGPGHSWFKFVCSFLCVRAMWTWLWLVMGVDCRLSGNQWQSFIE